MILAISLIIAGAATAMATVLLYCIIRGGSEHRRPTPIQPRPMDPLTVYLLKRETDRIAVEFALLEHDEGWRP